MFIAYSLIKFQDHGHRKKTQAILALVLLYTQSNLLQKPHSIFHSATSIASVLTFCSPALTNNSGSTRGSKHTNQHTRKQSRLRTTQTTLEKTSY